MRSLSFLSTDVLGSTILHTRERPRVIPLLDHDMFLDVIFVTDGAQPCLG